MRCPHCTVEFHPAWTYVTLQRDEDSGPETGANTTAWKIRFTTCPACGRLGAYLGTGSRADTNHWDGTSNIQIRPKGASRSPLSKDVSEAFAGDYREAVLVLADSPKASAALSRRCLQHLIRDKAGIKDRDLATEITKLIESKAIPSHLSDALDSVRVIGNFAAHPTKSISTGEIVDVEPGEAEWLLDTLESLFDFYFVQPAILKRKKDALNLKLAATGKPSVK